MCKRLIIDCSVMWYKCWWRMKSPDYQAASVIELEEYAKNLAGELYELIERFKPADIVLGIDSREWRSEYYRQYFADRVHFWKSRTAPSSWIMTVSQAYYRVEKSQKTGAWSSKKLTQKEELVLDLTDAREWIFFEKGKTPQYILDAHPHTFKTVQECPDWEGLKERFPTYKGGRNLDWPFETTYKDFKKKSLDLTLNLADTLGARAVRADWAEFDDIARAYADQSPAVDTVLVTTDQDLDQLLAKGIFLKIWNPGNGKKNPARWVEMSPELAEFHLLCKLVGGDSSDKIPGCSTWEEKEKGPKNNKTTYRVTTTHSTVTWDTEAVPKDGKTTFKFCQMLMDTFGSLAGCHQYLKKHEVDHSYTRNVALMHLGAAPATVKAACEKALAETKVGAKTYELGAYMLTDRQLRVIAQRANAARQEDLAAGIYEDNYNPPTQQSPSDRLGANL